MQSQIRLDGGELSRRPRETGSGLGKMNAGLEVTAVVVLALAIVHVQMLFENTRVLG